MRIAAETILKLVQSIRDPLDGSDSAVLFLRAKKRGPIAISDNETGLNHRGSPLINNLFTETSNGRALNVTFEDLNLLFDGVEITATFSKGFADVEGQNQFVVPTGSFADPAEIEHVKMWRNGQMVPDIDLGHSAAPMTFNAVADGTNAVISTSELVGAPGSPAWVFIEGQVRVTLDNLFQ